MAFIDEIQIHLKAGDGGDGVVRWLHEKGKEFGGPAGGNGGEGGSVYAKAVRDLGVLNRIVSSKELTAERGNDGGSRNVYGKKGNDLVIAVPIGTTAQNLRTGRTVELLTEGQEELLLHGGQGGLGNTEFKGSRNTRPEKATKGAKGEEADFVFELSLVVDAGLIGLPNAGKSSLLNSLTNAKAKVGNFPFTTLNPNLGVLYGYILADIPGLIEGAAEGKGLGDRFLRHITRTRILLHCVSLEEEDPLKVYTQVRSELIKYGRKLDEKRELVILTKSDTVTTEEIQEIQKTFSKEGITTETVSILDDDQVKTLSEKVTQILGGE